jgi:hypothetical protein
MRGKLPVMMIRLGGVSGSSVEVTGESIRVRRCAPGIGQLGEVRIGWIGFAKRQSSPFVHGSVCPSLDPLGRSGRRERRRVEESVSRAGGEGYGSGGGAE